MRSGCNIYGNVTVECVFFHWCLWGLEVNTGLPINVTVIDSIFYQGQNGLFLYLQWCLIEVNIINSQFESFVENDIAVALAIVIAANIECTSQATINIVDSLFSNNAFRAIGVTEGGWDVCIISFIATTTNIFMAQNVHNAPVSSDTIDTQGAIYVGHTASDLNIRVEETLFLGSSSFKPGSAWRTDAYGTSTNDVLNHTFFNCQFINNRSPELSDNGYVNDRVPSWLLLTFIVGAIRGAISIRSGSTNHVSLTLSGCLFSQYGCLMMGVFLIKPILLLSWLAEISLGILVVSCGFMEANWSSTTRSSKTTQWCRDLVEQYMPSVCQKSTSQTHNSWSAKAFNLFFPSTDMMNTAMKLVLLEDLPSSKDFLQFECYSEMPTSTPIQLEGLVEAFGL